MLSWSEMHAATSSETSRIAALYAEGQARILAALDRARARGSDTRTLEAIRAEIDRTLEEMRSGTLKWTEEAFPRIYEVGTNSADASLAAAGIYRLTGAMSGLHTQALQVLADNAYNRLSDVTDVIGRKVDDTLRAYALDAITGPMFGSGTAASAQSDIFTRIVANMDTVTRVRADDTSYLGFQVTPGGKYWDVQSYAEMAARTTLADTMRTGSMMRMSEAGVTSFSIIGGPNPCEDCQDAIDGSPYTADEIDELMADGGHFNGPNCVIEGTLVSSLSRLLAIYRRDYAGEVVTLRTSRGDELTVTPNHPILTPNGWVGAGQLNKGDDVICRAGSELPIGLGSPDDHESPALIEDVFGALSKPCTRRTLEGMAEDFHGDGLDGKIDVVYANGLLWSDVQSATNQSAVQGFLNIASESAGALDPKSPLHAVIAGPLHTTDCIMRRRRTDRPLLGSGSGSGDPLRVTLRDSDGYSRLGKESSAPALTDSELARDLCLGRSGEVETLHLVDVARRSFDGHVYNLATAERWFYAGDIVTHNCECCVVADTAALDEAAAAQEG